MFFSIALFALILIAVAAVLVGLTLVLMARMLLRPPRMTDGKATYVLQRISPGDLGLEFEELKINVRDERTGTILPIAAWWIPHPASRGKCAVLIHGYADGKVGAIAWARLWRELGYDILAIDLRAHGYSGGSHTTAGFYERHDVNQVLNQVLAERPEKMREVVIFGVSLGAAVALAVAEMRDDVAALVLECPYADYRHAVEAHARLMQMPLPSLVPLAVRIAEWMSDADFRVASPQKLLPRVNTPIMVIHADDDPFVPHEDAQMIQKMMQDRAARGKPAIYWRVPRARHVHGLAADPDEYRQRIAQFLSTCAPTPAIHH